MGFTLQMEHHLNQHFYECDEEFINSLIISRGACSIDVKESR